MKTQVATERTTLLAIHGVGFHHAGAVARVLTQALQSLEINVREFNWNELVDQPSPSLSDVILFLRNTARDFAITASLGFERPKPQGPYFGPRELALHNVLFIIGQCLFAFGLTTVLLLPPLFALGPLWSTLKTDLDWRYYMWMLPWALKVLFLIFTAIALVLVLQLLAGVVGSVVRLRLWPAFVTTRHVVLGLTNQLILGATALVSLRPSRLLFVGAFFALSLIPAALQRFQAGIDLAVRLGGWVYPASVVAFILANLLMTGLLAVGSAGWIFPLKITLDIFRYTGSRDYRAKLQEGLAAKVRAIPADSSGGRHVILAAHSLGSIIAIDALVNFGCFRQADSVTLVTAGSPLQRFFFRFFPGLLFPASPGAIVKAVHRRIARFEWVNVYRPFDYVGTRLGLARASAGQDISTRQWFRVLRSHSDYWSDVAVVRLVRDTFEKHPLTPTAPVFSDGHEYFLADPNIDLPGERTFAKILRTAAILLPFALVALNVGIFWSSKLQQDAAIDARHTQLEATGENAIAQVTHWQDSMSDDEFNERHHYQFDFTTQEGKRIESEIQTDTSILFSRELRRMNEQALQEFVRANCEYTRGRPMFFLSEYTAPCKRGGVAVRYLPQEPSFFTVLDFPAHGSTVWHDRDWEVTAWYILMSSLISWGVASYLGLPLLRILMGLRS